MKQRLTYLLKLYFALLLTFVVQKIFFIFVNIQYAESLSFGNFFNILWHGLNLDSVTSCYILALPAIIVLISIFFKHFPLRPILYPYYLIISLIVAVIFLADLVLYHFWGAKMDANDLIYAANPKDLFASLPIWATIVAFILIIAITWGYFLFFKLITPRQLPPCTHPLWSLLMLPLLGLIFLGMRGGVKESTANPSYAYFTSQAYHNHAALNPTFNMLHSLFKAEDLSNEFQFYFPDELNQIIGNTYQQDPRITDTLFTTPHPDILILLWEGGGHDMIMNDSVGPNIMRLKEEGIYFSNCYANNFRTDRGMVSLLSGWPGLPTTSLMKRSDKCRKLPSIARTLRTQGYHTRFIYGGDIDFTNVRGYLAETGYIDIWGDAEFPQSRKLSNWGAPDEYVLQSALTLPPSPHFTTLLTLSSHEPWDVPYHRLPDARQNSFAYTDSCIGSYIQQLRNTPQWDNLIVIITPDHGVPLSSNQSTSDWHVSHIPIVIIGGAVKAPCTIDRLMNQNDIAATLLAQLNLNITTFPFSRNILSPSYSEQPHFATHAYKNGINYIDSTGITTFDCINQKTLQNQFEPSAQRESFIKALLQLTYKASGDL